MRMNLKEVCQLDSSSLIHSLSCSLNVDTSRFLATLIIRQEVELQKRADVSVHPEMWPYACTFLRSLIIFPTYVTNLTDHSKHCLL